jgi:hypothetical protein
MTAHRLTCAVVCLPLLTLASCTDADVELGDPPSTESCTWSATGRNPFFISLLRLIREG